MRRACEKRLTFLIVVALWSLPNQALFAQSQYEVEVCQNPSEALIGPDRNDFVHNSPQNINESYLHNFIPPILPCGLEDANLVTAVITISVFEINNIPACNDVANFGNVLLNCPLTTSAICPIVQDVLSPGCSFGAGQPNTGVYTLDLEGCGVFPDALDVIGVDLVPSLETQPSCPVIQDAISIGVADIDYSICINYVYDIGLPNICDNTIIMACDDGDPCTINDEMSVDECDNTEICIPCTGELVATCDDTIELPCDDGDPCTEDDLQTVSLCDNTLMCVPCAGIPVADCTSTITLPCDDGDVCTENDEVIVSACDNALVCEPCAGEAVQACSSTVSISCNDGNDCTQDDVELVDACNNNIVCVPCEGNLIGSCDDTIELPCDDGDPCTQNDIETVTVCDNSLICIPCEGELVVDCTSTIMLPCDDGNPCTENDQVSVSACDNTLICIPCEGQPVQVCDNVISLDCDDGNSCTQNDVVFLDACDNSIICIPCQGTSIPPQNCDDGNCDNGVEVWDPETCECITELTVLGCTDPSSCNYNEDANCDFGCDYSCIDCFGVAFGTATRDSCGVCREQDDILRDLSCLDIVYVPNAFTPDNDGLNDYFSIVAPVEFIYFKLQIFDRWGQQVFFSRDPKARWFGSIDGGDYYGESTVYVYKLEYSFELPITKEKSGTVTLIR